VVAGSKKKKACFAVPSFHEGRPPDVAVCADADTGGSAPDKAGSIAKAESNARRLIPEEEGFGDMACSFSTLSSGRPRQASGALRSFPKGT